MQRVGTLGRWTIKARDLEDAGLGLAQHQVVAAKVASALAATVLAALLSLAVAIGPALVCAAAYVGFVIPSLVVEQRAASNRFRAERAVGTLVEWLEALVAAGRPAESALAALAQRSTGSLLLDRVLRRTADAYALGAPLFRSLAAGSRAAGILSLAAFAEELERSRDLGSGSLTVIRARRDALRAAERAKSLEASSHVEGRLMLVLVLCYLPALMLLVVVPLFIGLLSGLSLSP